MSVLFKGQGLCWIPRRSRCITFIAGEYSTDDAEEIAVLAPQYEHDARVTEDEKPKRGRKSKEALDA